MTTQGAGMRVVIFGATGMIGYGVLLECLDDAAIDAVVTVGRRPVAVEHPKLEQIEHGDFTDFSPIAEQLGGFDACMWCLGVSSGGMIQPMRGARSTWRHEAHARKRGHL